MATALGALVAAAGSVALAAPAVLRFGLGDSRKDMIHTLLGKVPEAAPTAKALATVDGLGGCVLFASAMFGFCTMGATTLHKGRPLNLIRAIACCELAIVASLSTALFKGGLVGDFAALVCAADGVLGILGLVGMRVNASNQFLLTVVLGLGYLVDPVRFTSEIEAFLVKSELEGFPGLPSPKSGDEMFNYFIGVLPGLAAVHFVGALFCSPAILRTAGKTAVVQALVIASADPLALNRLPAEISRPLAAAIGGLGLLELLLVPVPKAAPKPKLKAQ